MAGVSTVQAPKRKKQGYGKGYSKSSWNIGTFFDEDELASSKPSESRGQHQVIAPTPPALIGAAKQTKDVKHARPRPTRNDTFDVPSSDDEVTGTKDVLRMAGFQVRKTLVDDTDSSVSQPAPWERRGAKSTRDINSSKRRQEPASPEAQLKQDLERATLSPERNITSSLTPKTNFDPGNGINPITSPRKGAFANSTSAAARLAARRNEDSRPIQKRNALATDEIESTPRKRARTATPSKQSEDDVVMADVIVEPTCELSSEARVAKDDSEIFDFPTSSDDELRNKNSGAEVSKPTKRVVKRGKQTAYSSRPITKKGIYAPERLAEMVTTDTDTTEPPTRSPSTASRISTPQQLPSTPPSGKASSPETAVKLKGTMTPKQAQLWSQLLPSDPVVPSPSTLAIKDLKISHARGAGANSSIRRLTKSQSDAPFRRTRLVDRLKASAPGSEDENSDGEPEDVSEMIEGKSTEQEHTKTPKKPAPLERKISQTSQSKHQTSAAAISGPKITYASMRSYLPEDNLQEDFMVGLDSTTPKQAIQSRAVGKPMSTSQKSTFDIDDIDEDDASQGGIRTIHELRASGRTISGMYDIQELLSEIQNHNVSHRSRRRSALIELAEKLTEKAFASRFVGQSLETELGAECGAVPDEISDFVLIAAVALILVSEPPDHAVRSLRDQGILGWLTKVLDKDTDIVTLTKDRRNNMSKSAQASFAAFVDALKSQESLWGESRPTEMTSRLLGLKALDLQVSRVRRLGERDVLMDADQVSLILPKISRPLDERQIDVALSISVLELLSTTVASLQWSSGSIETIADILPQLNIVSAIQRHALFLMLRLCLNLSNDNTQNCELLSASAKVVPVLVNAIKQGFDDLDLALEDEKRALALDLLVLAMGIMINLTEQCTTAREQAIQNEESLLSLIAIFQRGQKHMLDAESVEESVSNVAFGYLAVMLSNICLDKEAGSLIASQLPGKNLGMLVEAVEEFVLHHQKVDMMNFEGEEGAQVWGVFTEKLKVVLARLKEAEQGS